MGRSPGYFITGTDTGVGKTAVTLGLMQLLQDRGQRVAGMKPVASGATLTPQGLRNDDATRLQQQSSIELDYREVNPVAFEHPLAPHIAAATAGSRIDLALLEQGCSNLRIKVDRVCVEGIGGWLVPLNERDSVADLAVRLGLEVILVVGIRLGCLNHALLTARAIETSRLALAGWVANSLPPPPDSRDKIINTLESMIYAPLLGVVPALDPPSAKAVAGYLALPGTGNS